MNPLFLHDLIFWNSYEEGQDDAETNHRREYSFPPPSPDGPYFRGYQAGLASKGVKQ